MRDRVPFLPPYGRESIVFGTHLVRKLCSSPSPLTGEGTGGVKEDDEHG